MTVPNGETNGITNGTTNGSTHNKWNGKPLSVKILGTNQGEL